MRYLLDTNVWIAYLKRADSPVAARLKSTPAADIAVCSVVWSELLHGAMKYEPSNERVARVEQTLGPFVSLPFEDDDAYHYADIRSNLEQRGELIGPNDLLIAAIARRRGLTLASGDAAFRRITGLRVEDWSSEDPAA